MRDRNEKKKCESKCNYHLKNKVEWTWFSREKISIYIMLTLKSAKLNRQMENVIKKSF
jgi:hypothetical protein